MTYQRKTKDVFEIQGYYGSQYGWECVTTEETWKEAMTNLRLYRENEPYSFRCRIKRVPIEVKQ